VSALERLRELAAAVGALALLVLLLSGWGLMAGYVPSRLEAFDSILYFRSIGGAGAFLRNLHHHAATTAVTAGALHLAAGLLLDAPHRSRSGWWAALGLYLLVLSACFTGYLLPMDQNAYWGNQVRLGIVESVPVVGLALADLLRGGGAVNAATLPRYYALHVSIQPFLMLLPLGVLVSGLRRRELALRDGQLWLGVVGIALAALYLAAAGWAAPLEPRGDPSDVDYTPRPEWYFLWLFQVGKYAGTASWIQSALVPGLLLGLAAGLPLAGSLSRPRRVAVVSVATAAWLGLTGAALWEDRHLPPRPSYEEALAARAGEIFEADCRSCHGEAGGGDGSQARAFGLSPPDMTSAAYWAQADPGRMETAIRDGSGADMPDFGKKLSTEEIRALVAFVERFRPE
jgi:ubiquinol-cytochrome c reductase cytochrome b subunit